MFNDFKYTEDGDLLIENGELFFDDSTKHHANIVINLNKGDDKFNPLLGCNLINYINGLTPKELISRAIRTELGRVGIKAKVAVVTEGNIIISDAKY